MKKYISALLALVLMLSLCACAGSGNANKETEPELEGLCVGFSKQDITPTDKGIPLAGYGTEATRVHETVLDKIYATCIAVTEGDQTVLLISQDLIGAPDPWTKTAREKISEATGVPVEKIIIAGTHTHAAPSIYYEGDSIVPYQPVYMAAVVKAAQEALADRSAATLYSGSTQLAKLAFVRHYKMADGSTMSSNTSAFDETNAVDYGMEVDNTMELVKFDREGDKKDILLMNWQAHPCFADLYGEGTQISADYIGVARNKIEQEAGMDFIFFLGAAGNQGASSRLKKDKNGMDMMDYGKALAQGAMDALPGLKAATGSGVKFTQLQYEYQMNRKDEDKLMVAKEVLSIAQSKGNTAADAYAKEKGLQSATHAYNINKRAELPDTQTMEINALSIAGIGFISAPYEMFSTASLYIKGNSPLDTTVVISCANGRHNYLANKESYDYYAYETIHAVAAQGTSEALAEKYVELLKGLQ